MCAVCGTPVLAGTCCTPRMDGIRHSAGAVASGAVAPVLGAREHRSPEDKLASSAGRWRKVSSDGRSRAVRATTCARCAALSSVCDTDEIRYHTPILGAERRCSRAVLSRSSRSPPPDVNVRVILLSQWLSCGREHLPRYAARHSTSVCGEVRWTQVCALICAPLCYLKSHGAPHGAGYRRSDR